MAAQNLEELLSGNKYPGRGIILGRSADGAFAVAVYFIMGRSANSRNRVFTKKGSGIVTEAADESKMADPRLIIYSPVREVGDQITVVTNGDQTDTICDSIEDGGGFAKALRRRRFEPDAPNYTPRISGIVKISGGRMKYRLSILKSDDGNPESAERFFFEYSEPVAGEGRLIHTYDGDGDPLPSFTGEPRRVALTGSIDELTASVWNHLNEDNRISLFVRYIPIEEGRTVTRIVNKYKKTRSDPAEKE